MAKTVPTPIAAAIGLVPAFYSSVVRLPGQIVQLPVLAVSTALSTLDSYRRGYDDLADRGERLVARLRGTSFDELEDRVEDALQGTPVAGLYDTVEDAAEDATESVGRALRAVSNGVGAAGDAASQAAGTAASTAAAAAGTAASTATAAAERAADTASGAADAVSEAAQDAVGTATGAAGSAVDAAGTATDAEAPAAEEAVPEAEQPKGVPTPKATQPDDTRIGTAASADVVSTVERVSAGSRGAVLEHDELPLADYDHMTLGSLRGRLRSLTVEQLVQVRDYEKAHADRLPVVTMLDNRIAKLATDPAATPTGNTGAAVPELQPDQVAQGGSKVTPATGGPALNPPSQGVPTNPGQPRTTGSPGTNPSSNA